jgi:IclR family mhp operon transcriptional activator
MQLVTDGAPVLPKHALSPAAEPSLEHARQKIGEVRCRTNSRRGQTDPARRSYPPVEAVQRALKVLRAVNKLRIASVEGIYAETRYPKSTIVRMLETLMVEGYVVRDNMCGGYRITGRIHELHSGYAGISQVIDVARPFAVDLTRRLKWPIGIGVFDRDAIAVQFWTGAISPWAHTNTVLGMRPNLLTTAMGRAYLAFCADDERNRLIAMLRSDPARGIDEAEEQRFRALLERIRRDGHAMRDPRTKPYRTTTLAVPLRESGRVHALMTISFFTTAIAAGEVSERILAPLFAAQAKIEESLHLTMAAGSTVTTPIEPGVELAF